jgi:molybdate transport system permease protein
VPESPKNAPTSPEVQKIPSDRPFLIGMGILGGSYLFIIAAMVIADLVFLDYKDQPVLGPEMIVSGRYSADDSGQPLQVEKGRKYQFTIGSNDLELQDGTESLSKSQILHPANDQLTLIPKAPDTPITASLRAEIRLTDVQKDNDRIILTTDLPHGRIWGEFIRIKSPLESINDIHEILDTEKQKLSINIPEKLASNAALPKPSEIQLSRPNPLIQAIRNRDIQFSIKLSLISCTVTTIFSLWVAVPIGYLLSRYNFRCKSVFDLLLDIPIVLPPLVIGLSLLILFRYVPDWLSDAVVYKWPAVILAQFMVACAFAVRTMRVTFEQIPQRYEQVALTLGCNRQQAFWRVILPQAKEGILAAGTLAWARSLGEFGPILVFAGATRQKTEVLPTSAFLELQAGRTEGMLAVSLIMIAAAALVFIFARSLGMKRIFS